MTGPVRALLVAIDAERRQETEIRQLAAQPIDGTYWDALCELGNLRLVTDRALRAALGGHPQ